jgi:hypothetical protein
MAKQVKVGVTQGGGPPPGYRWGVDILAEGYQEVMKFVNENQYCHLALQFKELAREADPSHPLTADVDAIEDFFELRDKGGILGGLNVRIFFLLDKEKSRIVVLGGIKKQNDGPTPVGAKIRMRRRTRKYRNGEYAEH